MSILKRIWFNCPIFFYEDSGIWHQEKVEDFQVSVEFYNGNFSQIL